MRGMLFTSLYTIMLILSLYVASTILGDVGVPPHPKNRAIDLVGNTGLSVFGNSSPCYVDINTFGDLNTLDKPVVKAC